MAYLGNSPARSFISFERQVFTIVNSQTAYTLDHSVTNENDIRLVINNIVQEPGSGKAYTASGTTLTLSAALVNGTDEMYCVFLGRAVGTVNAPAGSVASTQLAADSVTAAKLNDDIISGQTALGATPADTDEFLVSDAGVLKRMDYSYIKGETNTPYFQVSRQSSYQAVSATTDTTIQFNQVDLDTGSDWNSGTYKWTPEAGKYFLNARLTVDAGTIQGNFFIIYIRKNTTLLSQQIYRAYYNASFTLETSCVATANGSDTFDVQVYLQTGENIGYGARQSFFEGFKIAST